MTRRRTIVSLVAMLWIAVRPAPTLGFEPILLRETRGPQAAPGPCALAGNTDGTAANYRWYNLCSGYIWIYCCWGVGDGVGVQFGGMPQPEVNAENTIKRAITYYRNVIPNYGLTIDVYVNSDPDGDGCPDEVIAGDLDLDPGVRWNCSDFDVAIPNGLDFILVRQIHNGGSTPTFATDGPFSQDCDPVGTKRSFYYGSGYCTPWVGPTGRYDNFLTWLILDAPPANSSETTSWGRVKSLFQ